MVFRKILSTKLKINDKKLLREYYNTHNDVNLPSITKISRRMGLSSDEAYETLREYYNEDIDVKQKKNRKDKIKERLTTKLKQEICLTFKPSDTVFKVLYDNFSTQYLIR
jgi:hypothetical protein